MSNSVGKLVIVSGPSGAGKTTVLGRLLEKSSLPLTLSVSATTRPPRPGEKDGVAYHFLADKEFQGRRAAGDFLECMEVFGSGYWYGTLAETVTTSLQDGKWVVLEIDVEGSATVLQKYTDAITIFLHP
ncbi:MAG: guanylate kinase, partial [Pirellulaceae bacterium]|nr:guanylate kinase [Pirellulaceae bacterium]